MKKVLVTGANGFVGQHLVKQLKKMSYDIIELSSRDGDIASINLNECLKDLEIEHIFHLAAKVFVPESWEKPNEFYKTSVMGTINILEYARKNNTPLTFTSSYLYGEPESLPISEDHKIQPNNPYGHSKYLAEECCKFYAEFYNVQVNIIRPFNIFGLGQGENFLIPVIIQQVKNNNEIKVKDLLPKRDYIYIKDFIDALIKTINSKRKFAIYNIGSGIELSIQDIIDIIQKVYNTNKVVVSEQSTRKNEIMNVLADISSANNELGWQVQYSFEDAIRDMFNQQNEG